MPTTRTNPHSRARLLPRFGQTLRCPECGHFIGVGTLADGRKLRCTDCGQEIVVARDYDRATGEQHWQLQSPDDESREEFENEGGH